MNHHSKALLQSISKTADMGRSSLSHLLHACRDNAFCEVLRRQYDDSNRICLSAAALLGSSGEQADSAPVMSRMMSGIMVAASAVTDGSNGKFADMLVQGNNKGIAEIDRELLRCSGADARVRNLAVCLRDRLAANNRELQKYL